MTHEQRLRQAHADHAHAVSSHGRGVSMSPRVAPLPPSILSGVQLSAPHWFRVAGKGAQVRRSGAALGVEAGGAGGCNSWQQRGCLGSVVPSTASQKLQPELSRAPGHLWHGSFALEALLWTLRGKAGPWGSQAWPPLEGLEGVGGDGLEATPAPLVLGWEVSPQAAESSQRAPLCAQDTSACRGHADCQLDQENEQQLDSAFFISSFY